MAKALAKRGIPHSTFARSKPLKCLTFGHSRARLPHGIFEWPYDAFLFLSAAQAYTENRAGDRRGASARARDRAGPRWRHISAEINKSAAVSRGRLSECVRQKMFSTGLAQIGELLAHRHILVRHLSQPAFDLGGVVGSRSVAQALENLRQGLNRHASLSVDRLQDGPLIDVQTG